MTDYSGMSVHELLDDYIGWSAGDTQEQADMLVEIESALRRAIIREASVGVEDTEVYAKMVKAMAYWKGRYEMAVRGMTDKAAVEIMGYEP